MSLRSETPQESPAIYELVRIAFQTVKVSSGQEQDFVNELRSRK